MSTSRRILLLTMTCVILVGSAGCNGHRSLIPGIEQRDVIRVESKAARLVDVRANIARGIAAVERGELDAAASEFKQAIRQDPSSGPAHNNLGRVYFHQRKLKLAAEAFTSATQLMPGRPEPVNNLGLVLEAAGRTSDAILRYEEAHLLEPDNPEYLANFVRARIRQGDSEVGLQEQLQQLRFIEHRPEWVRWVEEQLIYLTARQERATSNMQPLDPHSPTFADDIDEASLHFEIGPAANTDVSPMILPPANRQ